jgi:hypothetical protein
MHSMFDAQLIYVSYEMKARFQEMEKASRQAALVAEAFEMSGSTEVVTRTHFFMMFWVRRVLFRLAPSVAYRLAI